MGLGDSSVGRAHAVHAWGPEFGSPGPTQSGERVCNLSHSELRSGENPDASGTAWSPQQRIEVFCTKEDEK